MTEIQPDDRQRLLRQNAEVFDARTDKAMSAAIAVHQVLSKRQPLNGQEGEFLRLFSWLHDAHTEEFCRIWTSPRAYHWSRVAYQLLGMLLGTTDTAPTIQAYMDAIAAETPREALDRHLQEFKAFAIALAWRTKQRLVLEGAFVPTANPWSIPSTPWSVSAARSLRITGVDSTGRLCAQTDTGDVELSLHENTCLPDRGISIFHAPVLIYGENEIHLNPHALDVPGLTAISTVVPVGVEFQWQHAACVQRALDAMKRYDPSSFDQFVASMRVIALKPEAEGTVYNTSCSRLPGAAIFTAFKHPLVMADDLIHEFRHNQLFAIEDVTPFFDKTRVDPIGDPTYYSPWRDDPRPLYGLLHALYAFTPVCRFWLNVFRCEKTIQQDREYAQNRVARLQVQLHVTMAQLADDAAFTEFGQVLFDELSQHVAALEKDIALTDISADSPSLTPNVDGTFAPTTDANGRALSVRESLISHAQENDVHGRCPGSMFSCSPAA